MRLRFCLCPPGTTGLMLYWAWLAVFLFYFFLCVSSHSSDALSSLHLAFFFSLWSRVYFSCPNISSSVFPQSASSLLYCHQFSKLIFLLVPNSFIVGKLNPCVWSGGRATLWALCLMWPISPSALYALGNDLCPVLEGYKVICAHDCACVRIWSDLTFSHPSSSSLFSFFIVFICECLRAEDFLYYSQFFYFCLFCSCCSRLQHVLRWVSVGSCLDLLVFVSPKGFLSDITWLLPLPLLYICCPFISVFLCVLF